MSLTGLYLANNYTNLTNWAFPSGAAINPGQFKVIFADSQTNLSTLAELHTSFTLASGSGSLALSRLYSGQPQVLDYLDYTNIGLDHSYGSFPDGQSFLRQEFFPRYPGRWTTTGRRFRAVIHRLLCRRLHLYSRLQFTPQSGRNLGQYRQPGYHQRRYLFTAQSVRLRRSGRAGGNSGGLGLAALAGWYGLADFTASVGIRFGATDGDQTTGGQISFGLPNSSNRALGLLATSTTGFTALAPNSSINPPTPSNTSTSNSPVKSGASRTRPRPFRSSTLLTQPPPTPFSTNHTAFLPALNVAFPTVPAGVGGVAVDGTMAANQTNLSVLNQVITNWLPGAALWLVWEMADSAGKAQGLGIDNLRFSALSALNTPPVLAPINNQTLILGQTLSFTPSVTDTDLPPQIPQLCSRCRRARRRLHQPLDGSIYLDAGHLPRHQPLDHHRHR